MNKTNKEESNHNMLNSKQVAILLGWSRRTVQMWTKNGSIPAFRAKRFWRYHKDIITKGIADGLYIVKTKEIKET